MSAPRHNFAIRATFHCNQLGRALVLLNKFRHCRAQLLLIFNWAAPLIGRLCLRTRARCGVAGWKIDSGTRTGAHDAVRSNCMMGMHDGLRNYIETCLLCILCWCTLTLLISLRLTHCIWWERCSRRNLWMNNSASVTKYCVIVVMVWKNIRYHRYMKYELLKTFFIHSCVILVKYFWLTSKNKVQ